MKTTSLEVGKRLMEAEIGVDSHFSWSWIDGEDEHPVLTEDYDPMFLVAYAPTADELGDLLPQDYATMNTGGLKPWCCFKYLSTGTGDTDGDTNAGTMADAIALMLIKIKEGEGI